MGCSTRVQKTSLEAYQVLEPELGSRKKMIYKLLKVYPDRSNHDISRIGNIPINSVTQEYMNLGIKVLLFVVVVNRMKPLIGVL